jgi:formylglycine-generating enzyme required for sulfatase activity
MRATAVMLGLFLLWAASAGAQDIVSQLGNPGPAYTPGMKPSTLGWGPDDRAYPDKCVINPTDLAEMVWVPAGTFRMGITDEDLDRLWQTNGWDPRWKGTLSRARPAHEVTLTKGFWLYRHGVTNGQYMKFMNESQAAATPLPEVEQGYPKVPVRGTWIDADLYAQWAGVQLVTEAQREWAARGPEQRLWPWGNEWDSTQCNSGNYWAGTPLDTLAIWKTWYDDFEHDDQNPIIGEAGTMPGNVSWCGAWDLSGKLWEWCRDWFEYRPHTGGPATDPEGPAAGRERVMRGGAWGALSHNTLAMYRTCAEPTNPCEGYRMVIVPDAAP